MNSINTVNNSKRPNNIPRVKIHFALSGREPKVPDGPITSPKPGPTLAIEVAAPEEHLGAIIGDLRARRAQIREIGQSGEIRPLSALVPLRLVFGYSTDLRSATQGKAEYTMEFSKYAPVPAEIAEELTKEFNESADSK